LPPFGEYEVTVQNGTGQTSDPFVIGVLEDYPKDAPEMLFPQHFGVTPDPQPRFEWEVFKSIYLGQPVDNQATAIDLRFPDGRFFTAWPIPGDQTTLDYLNQAWDPSQPPILSPGNYSVTIHSHHDVAPGFGFEHHRIIEFTVLPSPQAKDDCMNGGWEQYGFKNQGLCVRYIETGKDSRIGE
jgi:hypothetical protein